MPSKEAHISAAKQNEAALRYLLQSDDHLAWVVTVAFYKALHIVEAIFDADAKAPEKHTDDHWHRNALLKKTTRYAHIWAMYRELWQASLIARYLREDAGQPAFDIFSRYMPRAKVESFILNHCLAQIEKSAEKFLGANFLD